MVTSAARPLVVCLPDGRPREVLQQNEKGYRKTLERGRLWALHPGTGRLLPFHEHIPVTISDRHGWYEAVLAGDPEAPATPGGAPPAAPAQDASGESDAESRASEGSGLGDVIEGLAALVAERHTQLPEGSYTTHLFTSGAEKIRKKLGEEAVELLLASNEKALVSETADLLYHLLVLLESERIPLAAIARELRGR